MDDQIRACQEYAAANGIEVPPELIFADKSERGHRRRREGFQAMQEALRKNEFEALLVFKTSRLHRKTYRSLQFVEEEIVDRRKRCIFVFSRIDTADGDRWRGLLHLYAMVDELSVQMGADHIRAAHEGMLDVELVFGTIAYGYLGEPIPGTANKKGQPRRRLAIDTERAEWVRRGFHWYVSQGHTIAEIIRRLNAEKAPLPPRCETGMWTRQAVRLLLSNPRYRGFWIYGDTKATYLGRQDYVRQFRREQPLRTKQIERLRLVDDELWCAAQKLLAEEAHHGGRKAKIKDRRRRPDCLENLFYCEAHEHRMYVGGTYGRYYFCPVCKRTAEPALRRNLNREVALTVLSRWCALLIQTDADLVERVIGRCREHAERAQKSDPQVVSALREKEVRINRKIEFILENPGLSSDDERENAAALAIARRERAAIKAEIRGLEAAAVRPVIVPTGDEVRAKLNEFAETLKNAGESDNDIEVAAVRKLLRSITGGQVRVSQVADPERERGGYLQGRFKPQIVSTTLDEFGMREGIEARHQVTLEFVRPCLVEDLGERAVPLYEQKLSLNEIARQLGVRRSVVVKALRRTLANSGTAMSDGRARRWKLPGRPIPKYQKIADEVMRFVQEQRLFGWIAEHFGVSANLITQSIRWWHESHGLPVPDGRTRRRSLTVKTIKRRAS